MALSAYPTAAMRRSGANCSNVVPPFALNQTRRRTSALSEKTLPGIAIIGVSPRRTAYCPLLTVTGTVVAGSSPMVLEASLDQ